MPTKISPVGSSSSGGAGSGDVNGPVSSTDNAIARWDGTTGQDIQNSAAFVDDNGNVYAPNTARGYATTATAAGTTTLTVASKGVQTFTGATTQIVALPVVSTLPQTGFGYWIINDSSGAVTVNSSGGNAVQVVAAGGRVVVLANALSGTGASVWDKVYWLAGSGDVTASGTLTADAVILGNGTTVVKAAVGVTAPASGEMRLGVDSTVDGVLSFVHIDGGTMTIAPQAGDISGSALSVPATTGTFTVNEATQTITNKTIDCDSNTVTNVSRLKVDADNTLPATCAKGEVLVLDNGTFWSGQATNDWQQVLTANDIGGVRAVTGTTDTILSTDFSKLVTFTNAGTIAVTLPQAGSGSPAAFTSGWYFTVQNIGSTTVTITPTTSTINGAASLAILGGQFTTIFSNGTNYLATFPVNKVNGLTVTNSTGTLTVTNAKTASFSNSITFAGTDSTTQTFPSTSQTVAGLTATQTLSAKTISVSGALGTDDTCEGIQIAGLNAGATIAQWEAVYMGGSSKWLLADANGSSTYPAQGLAVAAYVDTNAALVLVQGTVRNDAWNWTIGGAIYLSTTPGALTQTAPSTSGDKIQRVGYALTADIAYFDFNSTYLTVT